ncbi:MAG: FkbM family methyltransferase [Infirmifilum sp.]
MDKAILRKIVSMQRVLIEKYLDNLIVIRHSMGPYFLVRPNTADLYDIALAESYELKKWFLPRVGDVIVDVGAYIGKCSMFACVKQNVRRIVSIEPVPANAAVIRANAKLNKCDDKVSVVEEAVASTREELVLYIPYDLGSLSLGGATLEPEDGRYLPIHVRGGLLDDIMQRLGIERVDFLKIDIEGYVSKALPGMIETMRRTRFLQIELLRRDLLTYKKIKQLGFKLVDKRSDNYLFQCF